MIFVVIACIVDVSLGRNQFAGTIRDSFSRFFALESVDFSNNQLTGAIPSRLFALPNIKSIRLESNSFDGTIPQNVGNAARLEVLSLQENTISGTVPPIGASQFQKLSELQLFDNQLSGSIPESLCHLVAEAALEELSADCGGVAPRIDCPCCTVCFDASLTSRR
mmetsp:Transcript_5198/g.12416  ORF Transcript_5198/g.12416 Transcript_5198/m.12416 type:complete len:165 (-) Transcript_5198:2366-2860(-)